MSDYKGIQGTAVQNFAGDPGDPIAGQVWYDSVSSSFKYQNVIPTGAWATGGSLNTARTSLGGAGIKQQALAFGGINLLLQEIQNLIMEQLGQKLNDLNTARVWFRLELGTNTAALAFGGLTFLVYMEIQNLGMEQVGQN
jgi:hypothetical protein